MDLLNKVMAVLWQILDKNKRCAINVSTIDNKLTVNILRGRRRNTYADEDYNIVLLKLKQHLLA